MHYNSDNVTKQLTIYVTLFAMSRQWHSRHIIYISHVMFSQANTVQLKSDDFLCSRNNKTSIMSLIQMNKLTPDEPE